MKQSTTEGRDQRPKRQPRPARATQDPRPLITEIFHSLQGETRTIGYPTAFIRFTGCPLRCAYCDTTYAFQGGRRISLPQILATIHPWQPRFVTVTGGEPLAQPACRPLITRLCDAGYQVSLETSGALDIALIDPRASIVMDLKTPGSGQEQSNHYPNLTRISPNDQIKFVLCDRHDYQWAKAKIAQFHLLQQCEVLFLPVQGKQGFDLPPADLADWILADRLPVRMQIQLHKHLWGDAPGR
uniref:7-carboxy-7-deazaguanine synthase n=1 Tax=Candidatus Kentrum sp. MB TaxID=2138164 RepID=A0A450XJY7_9GAMM|nr:MAG: 7-carboxy-7-deazaguanine synthase [Candidatus Kentron sp. MB]